MNEKEYHKSRVMFCIKDKRVFVISNVEYSHAEWFKELGFDIETTTRGTYNKDLFFYVGTDFDITEEAEKEFFAYLPQLVNMLELKPDVKIYGGTIIGEVGQQWKGKKYFGEVKDFIQ